MNARQIIKVVVVGGIIMTATQAMAWEREGGHKAPAATSSSASKATSNSMSYSEAGASATTNVKNANTQRQGQGQGQTQGQAVNNGQTVAPAQDTTFKSEAAASAPVVIPPGLVASPIVCMGAISGGAGVSTMGVGAGISMGKTYTDATCERVVLSNALRALGKEEAALEILAADPRVAEALGRKPVVKVAAPVAVPTAAIVEPERTADNFGQR